MGKRVSAEAQKEAASKLLEDVSSIEGVEGRSSDKDERHPRPKHRPYHMPTICMERSC